ncbi:SAM-dependent methyltransferase [Ceratobasidium sp. AG-Ba]|nr:SAM-dependent methyltransferase [Ceratobasidium sp. AG-Ba]QRW04006.1 SAM-dependent methyltransferase [Ceratobasidium sp. AG-Ba]
MMRDERRHLPSHNFAALLVHDLLFNRGGIQAADGPIKQAIYRHKTRLQAELAKTKIRRGAQSNQDLEQPSDPRAAKIPRYLRVNQNMWSIEEAVEYYSAREYVASSVVGLPLQNQFSHDIHVPDLFIFNSNYPLHSDEAYKTGKMIAQDKASCFPALVLNPPISKDACVIDATAAPGNKTSHLSSLMKNQGNIFAFERNQRRFQTLKDMLRKTGCINVDPILGDFLDQDPNNELFARVTHILLDPSCSGSGIVNRLDYLTSENTRDDAPRLASLSIFQRKMILHAMKFPAVTRIVYSTCSIHIEENEAVVEAVLRERPWSQEFILAHRTQVLPNWDRRGALHGALSLDQMNSLVRCSPGEDIPGTNGFFVACFVRKVIANPSHG